MSEQFSLFGPTLDEARDQVFAALPHGGGVCPCCDQLVRLRRQVLNVPLAKALIWLVAQYERRGGWRHISEAPMLQGRPGGGDFAKLEHWGLIESRRNTDSNKRTSGWWRPTSKGIDFVCGRVRVPKYVLTYNRDLYSLSPESVDIIDAMESKWDYEETLRGYVEIVDE